MKHSLRSTVLFIGKVSIACSLLGVLSIQNNWTYPWLKWVGYAGFIFFFALLVTGLLYTAQVLFRLLGASSLTDKHNIVSKRSSFSFWFYVVQTIIVLLIFIALIYTILLPFVQSLIR